MFSVVKNDSAQWVSKISAAGVQNGCKNEKRCAEEVSNSSEMFCTAGCPKCMALWQKTYEAYGAYRSYRAYGTCVQNVREGMSKMCGRGCPRCPGGDVQNVREGVSKMSRMVVKLKSVVLKRSLIPRKCGFIVGPSVSDGGSGTSLSERGHYTESIMLNDYPKPRSGL